MVKKIKKILSQLSICFYLFVAKYKMKTSISDVFIGVGTGVIANVMFVITTTNNYNFISLIVSFVFAIILLLIGGLERKDR